MQSIKEIIMVHPIKSLFLVDRNDPEWKVVLIGIGDRVTYKGEIVMYGPTRYAIGLIGVDNRVDNFAESQSQDLGEDFVISVEQGYRSPVLNIQAISRLRYEGYDSSAQREGEHFRF